MDRCVFCVPQAERVFVENDLAFALWDAFPVTERHALILPRRHIQDYFALTSEELLACDDLLRQARELVLASDPSVEGFNVGANVGEVAGQTIFHCHIHLIPRRSGDVENPRGGVRHLIPGKGAY
ncbi:MAG: HIT family protein [Acidobacteria bacterium]|nr:HIT family protein [Acidobacteriota bacterium]